MSRLLPPLKSLQVFEAVARYQNFSRAAEEMNITQSAVSHQIRQLEYFLGQSLINRKDKPMSLTRAGRLLFPCVEEALSSVSTCVSQLMGRSEGIVRLGAFMHFALKSLLTKLPDFRSRYPNIDLRLEMLTDSPDLHQLKSDVVILVNKQPPDYDCRLLRQETWFPVCSPEIYAQLVKEKDTKALFKYPFLCLENVGEWKLWSEAVDIRLPRAIKFHRFSHLILCLQAAVEGQGIALGVNSLVEEDIRAGRLKKLPFNSTPIAWQHFLCVQKQKRSDPSVQLLVRWLLQTFGEDPEK